MEADYPVTGSILHAGSQVLLSRRKNTAAQNFEFDRKRDTYFKKGGVAPFALTADVLNSDSWTPEHLLERHQRLRELLTRHWRLNVNGNR